MTKIKYNKKQLEAINAKDDNIVIIAPAGSGKTSTLVGAIKRYKDDNPDKNVVAITFTRKSAQDLSEKLGTYSDVETSTIHSWAYRELDRLSVKVREKYPNKSFKVKLLQEDKIKEILTDILKRRNYSYVKVNILYSYIMGNYNMDISESLKNIFGSVLAEYIRYKRANGLYDFTDLPLYLLTKLEDYDEYIENIDGLFVDEFQDVDETQLELFNRVRASKRFYIGDPKQCQPAGTKVRMANGEQKNIEEIKVGDRVVSYFPKDSYISGCQRSEGYKVLETKEREFNNDYLITVVSENGKISRYTPNHKTFAAIRKDNPYNHLIYLMEDNRGRFRIGTSQFYKNYNGQDMSTFRHKLMSEGYRKAWILGVYKTDKEARLYENKYSYEFQLPQITFQDSKSRYSQEDIDFIYENIDSYSNAKQCLNYLKLDIKYPFLTKDDKMDFRRDAFRKFYAINLIPEVMSILTHDATKPATRLQNRVPSKLIKIEKDFIEEPIMVYSLKVDKHETYIADDIVTHNSIYIFRGATEDVIDRLRGFEFYELDKNYRSKQEIIDFASTFQDLAGISNITFSQQLESYQSSILCDKGEGGEVYIINHFGDAFKPNEFIKYNGKNVIKELMAENPMILCRKNKEVKYIENLGYSRVQTIHQAKGLEYDNVIVTDFDIKSKEDINIAYVAMTRAKNKLLATNYKYFVKALKELGKGLNRKNLI